MPKLVVAGINIKVHPHPNQEIYVHLLKDAYKIKKEVHSRADQFLLLQSVEPIVRGEPLEGLKGKIARFTNINPNQPWLNLSTNDQADEDALQEIVIPPFLRPNYSGFQYIFFPKKHRLVYEKYNGETSLSPGIVKSYFEKLFSSEQILSKYGDVDVNVINDDEQLEQIFSMYQLNRLEMDIQRPNPDDLEEAERKVWARMDSQHIREQRIQMLGVKNQSIAPNADTQTLAKIASQNGEVRAEGYDENGEKIEFSTTEHPKIMSEFYDVNAKVTREGFILHLARRFLGLQRENT